MGLIATIKQVGSVINIFKKAKSEFDQVLDLVKTFNSDQADKTPAPANSEPDYKQLIWYGKKSAALASGIIHAVIKELGDGDTA